MCESGVSNSKSVSYNLMSMTDVPGNWVLVKNSTLISNTHEAAEFFHTLRFHGKLLDFCRLQLRRSI